MSFAPIAIEDPSLSQLINSPAFAEVVSTLRSEFDQYKNPQMPARDRGAELLDAFTKPQEALNPDQQLALTHIQNPLKQLENANALKLAAGEVVEPESFMDGLKKIFTEAAVAIAGGKDALDAYQRDKETLAAMGMGHDKNGKPVEAFDSNNPAHQKLLERLDNPIRAAVKRGAEVAAVTLEAGDSRAGEAYMRDREQIEISGLSLESVEESKEVLFKGATDKDALVMTFGGVDEAFAGIETADESLEHLGEEHPRPTPISAAPKKAGRSQRDFASKA